MLGMYSRNQRSYVWPDSMPRMYTWLFLQRYRCAHVLGMWRWIIRAHDSSQHVLVVRSWDLFDRRGSKHFRRVPALPCRHSIPSAWAGRAGGVPSLPTGYICRCRGNHLFDLSSASNSALGQPFSF